MELYGYYLGLQTVETASDGITIVTGDMRALFPFVDTGPGGTSSAATMAVQTLILDAAEDWNESLYGGEETNWFQTAMNGIGWLLGLGHAYDADPVTVMSGGYENDLYYGDPQYYTTVGELIYPGDQDIISGRHIFRPDGTDVDVYQFTIEQAGVFSAETVAERLGELSVPIAGDANGDGKVDDADAATLADNWQKTGAIREQGDFNGDGIVNGVDATIISANWHNEKPNEPSLLDSQLKLYDDAGTLIVANDDYYSEDSYIEVDLRPGTYYVAVSSTGNNQYDLDVAGSGMGGTTQGEYDLRVSFMPDVDAHMSDTTGTRFDGTSFVSIFFGVGDGTFWPPEYYEIGVDPTAVELGDITGDGLLDILVANGGENTISRLENLGGGTFTAMPKLFVGHGPSALALDDLDGDWGGLVMRNELDYEYNEMVAPGQQRVILEEEGIFLNYVNHADISYGGGQVTVNYIVDNSINGIFIRVNTGAGKPMEELEVYARWDDIDIVHVVLENLIISGTPGGPVQDGLGNLTARRDGRLAIDPGIIVKLDATRIEAEMGAQLIAEGNDSLPVVFTSLNDDRYGMGGTFDSGNNAAETPAVPGDWGGIYFAPVSSGSIDNALIAYGGGSTPIEGRFADFNTIEIHQAEVRIAQSVFEYNASNASGSDFRNGRNTATDALTEQLGSGPGVSAGNEVISNIPPATPGGMTQVLNAASTADEVAQAIGDAINNATFGVAEEPAADVTGSLIKVSNLNDPSLIDVTNAGPITAVGTTGSGGTITGMASKFRRTTCGFRPRIECQATTASGSAWN